MSVAAVIDAVGGWLAESEWLMALQDYISAGHILFVLANAAVLLIAIHTKPIRRWRQFFTILLYLFAAGAICYMTYSCISTS